MPFHLYTSNRMEVLVDQLADVLKEPLSDPFWPETIILNSRGMESWLKQQLAHRLKIVANVQFPFLNAFIRQLYGRHEKLAALTEGTDDFNRPVLIWRIMQYLDECGPSQPANAILREYIGSDGNAQLRQFQLALHLAQLFDQYQISRPKMLHDWEHGKTAALSKINLWQPELWKWLKATTHQPGRNERLQQLIESMDLPVLEGIERISVFGISTMPPIFLAVLNALSARIPVHLFFLNPCEEDWSLDMSRRRREKREEWAHIRNLSPEDLRLETGNPLLSSMGMLGQQFFIELLDQTEYNDQPRFIRNTPSPDLALLAQIQNDILERYETQPGNNQKTQISEGDTSIQIHACHSPLREIEVLKDQLLNWFAQNKTLTPMDVLVMAPDITEYTPFIEAVFSNQSQQKPDYIPYSISDRRQGLESQIVNAFLTLLRLPNSRLKAAEVMDLLAVPAIHQKFGLNEADLLIIRQWLASTGVRWGWNAAHREELGLPAYPEASWEFGLNRLLAGYAIGEVNADTEDWLFENIAPFSDVEGDSAETLGRFLEFVTSLRPLSRRLAESRTPAEWCPFLTEQILDRFFVSDDANYRDLLLLRMTLENFSRYATEGKYEKPVAASLVEDYLSTNFQETNDGDGFFRGKVTFCSLLPMRSVPVKIICLLGMNDGAFPRPDRPLGFDLMAESWQRCDRSQRYDDRYMFLESIISARQQLYISYIGRSNRENNKIPPSVLVAELKDYLQERFVLPPSTESEFDKEELLFCEVEHRLQPFNRQYFDNSIYGLYSYSTANFEGARRLLVPPQEKVFFPNNFKLPEPGPDENELLMITPERLAQFFASPCEFLLRQRLRINLRLSEAHLENDENFEPDNLQIYFLKQEITRAILSDIPFRECQTRLHALGMLPPGADGDQKYSSIWQEMQKFFTETPIPGASQTTLLEFLRAPKPEPKIQEVFEINGTAVQYSGILEQWLNGQQVYFRCAKNRPQDLLRGFIWHLTATLHQSSDSYLRGYENKKIKAMLHFPAMEKPHALEILEKLVGLYLTGLQQPLPFSAGASFDFYQAQLKSDIPVPVKWELSAYEALCFQKEDRIAGKFAELAASIFENIAPEEVKLT